MSASPDLESVAFLQNLVECNLAVSDYLSLPLDPVEGAGKYECASQSLATPMVWPVDVKVKAMKYQVTFPWLYAIFEAKQPGARCPVWERVAELLADNEKFLERLAERTRSWSFRRRTKGRPGAKAMPALDRKGEAKDEFGFVAWEMVRIVIGKAAEWLEKWKIKVEKGDVKPGESWLDLALDCGRADSQRPVREQEIGRKRLPLKDGTTANADPTAGSTATPKKKVKLQTDLQRHEDESRTERPPPTDSDEQPDAMAQIGELDATIRMALERLTPHERLVMNRRFWERWSLPEIDSHQKWKKGTAAKHWKSSKAKLKNMIPREYRE